MRPLLSLLLGALAALPGAAFAGETTFPAFAPLVIAGEGGVVGADGIAVTEGTLTGPVLAEPDLREFGTVRCTLRLTMNSATLAEAASGTCRIQGESPADALLGTFTCTGVFASGCTGTFTITGGEGAQAGASGGGDFTVTTAHSVAAVAEGGRLVQVIFATGKWPSLTIGLP